MNENDPRHGEYRGAVAHYKDGEELCAPCRDAHRRYNRRHKKMTRRGDTMRIPADRVQKRVRALRESGMSLLTIAERAGCSSSAIDNIANGRRKWVSVRLATGIATVRADDDSVERVASWRVERRLQALHALGWTIAELGRRTGWSAQNLNAMMFPRWRQRQTVGADTFTKVDALYASLCMEVPQDSAGAKVAKQRASDRGWATPLMWDDIDDEDEQPALVVHIPRRASDVSIANEYDPVVVERVLAGDYRYPATVAEKREVVRRWPGAHNELGRLTGWKIERYIDREDGAA